MFLFSNFQNKNINDISFKEEWRTHEQEDLKYKGKTN